MKSADLYRVLRADLGPWFKARSFNSYRRAGLGFQKIYGGQKLIVWFQCNKWGWDKYAGSSFFVNLGLIPVEADHAATPNRIDKYLTDEELEAARVYRNEVVARLVAPPESHFRELQEHFPKSELGEQMIQAARNEFLPVQEVSRHPEFRYFQPNDAAWWAAFLHGPLDRAMKAVVGDAQPSGPADGPASASLRQARG